MTIADKRYAESSACSRLLELVRQTKRYSICEIKVDQFEVIDDRYLLNRLLQFPELRPTTNDSIQIEFDEALEALSPGPTVTLDDTAMLDWLMTTVEVLDPKGQNTAFNVAYEGAVVVRGTFRQAEYFILAALNHRVQ